MDYGTRVLKKLLKRIKKMTPEEYSRLYEAARKDMEEHNIPNMRVVLDVSKQTLQKSNKQDT